MAKYFDAGADGPYMSRLGDGDQAEARSGMGDTSAGRSLREFAADRDNRYDAGLSRCFGSASRGIW